jgi:hypothetical protein
MERFLGRFVRSTQASSFIARAPAQAAAETAANDPVAQARDPALAAWMPRPEVFFQERPQRLLVPGLCAAFILIGLVLMLNGWDRIRQARASALWPTVRGVIVGAEVDPVHTSEGQRWRPIITYKYVARGRELTSTRISLQEPATDYDERSARRYVAKYRLGRSVTVFYNPDRFTESVLEQSVPRSAYISMGLGMLFALPGSGLVLIIGMTLGRRRLESLRQAPPSATTVDSEAEEAHQRSRPAAA